MDAQILGNYEREGFRLLEPTPNLLLLLDPNNAKVATFNKINATRQVIQTLCFEWRSRQRRTGGSRAPYRKRSH